MGLAELRRNLGAIPRRVAKGERLEITDRGRPVALLLPTRTVAPVTPGMSPFEQLLAEGRARMPVGNVLDLPPPEGEISTVAGDAVIEAREREERLREFARVPKPPRPRGVPAANGIRHAAPIIGHRETGEQGAWTEGGRRPRLGTAGRMCYIVYHMKNTPSRTPQVGIRELRQNLSIYLRRVARGERLELTDRGRPVALLVPIRPDMSPIERLVAEGRATMPVGDLLDLPLPKGEPDLEVLEALDEERAERL